MAKKTAARRVGRVKRIRVRKRPDVSRAEFNRLVDLLNERSTIINDMRDNQEIQFRRLAQLQAEVDLLKRAWDRLRADG